MRQYAKQRGWSVVRVYADKVSGLKSSRPALDELLRDARKRKFSCVAVWRIDRLGRSVSHLLQVLETFKALGISFVSFTEAIDTSTATGMMVFTVLAAVAALERSILVERIRMGLDVQLGRPAKKKLDAGEIKSIRARRLKGATLRQLAKEHGSSLWSIYKVCST